MNTSSSRGFRWRDLSIRAKLGLVFGMQLLLVVALGLTAFFGLQSVQRQRTILLEAQRVETLASELELEFVEARAIQRNFLLGWQNLGHREAVERFVPAHTRSVEDIRQTAGEVEALLAVSDLDSAPRARRDTKTLIAVADFYEGRFLETVEVLELLAAEEGGAFTELDRRILALQVSGSDLQVAGGDPDDRSVVEGIFTLREHQDLYRFSGDPVILQSLRQEAGFLGQRIDTLGDLGAPEAALATQQALQTYLAQVDTVESLSDEFRDKSASLDALIDEAQPIWEEVAASAREEATQAETNADRIGRVVNVAVAVAIATTVIVGTFVTAWLWQDFSNRLAGLTQATRRLQAGDLTARADVAGEDDFGQVATAFNAMADQLQGMVTGLEAQAGARARDLATIAEVSQAIASLRSPDVLLQDVVELVRERFNFYHAQVFLIDDTGRYAILRESTGEAGRALLA